MSIKKADKEKLQEMKKDQIRQEDPLFAISQDLKDKLHDTVGETLTEAMGEIQEIKNKLQVHKDANACVKCAEANLNWMVNKKDHPFSILIGEINSLRKEIFATKTIWKGAPVGMVPFGHTIHDDLERLEQHKLAAENAVKHEVAISFGFESFKEAEEIVNQEQQLWEEAKRAEKSK